MTRSRESDRHALAKLDGDAYRDGDPYVLAREILDWHADIARCYCRVCVMARALLEGKPIVDGMKRMAELFNAGEHEEFERVADELYNYLGAPGAGKV